MILKRPLHDCSANASASGAEPPEQRIEATIIGRLVREVVSSVATTQLVLAVNVATWRAPGCERHRSHHATVLLLHLVAGAHQAYRGGCLGGLRSGVLVRVQHALLELVPFTHDYEAIDHRLQARITRAENLVVIAQGNLGCARMAR